MCFNCIFQKSFCSMSKKSPKTLKRWLSQIRKLFILIARTNHTLDSAIKKNSRNTRFCKMLAEIQDGCPKKEAYAYLYNLWIIHNCVKK